MSKLFPTGFPHQGEIYWVNFSPSRGKEMKDIHPCLIISNNTQNEHGHYVIVAPITSTIKKVRLFEVFVNPSQENGLEKPSKILLNQIRSLDKQRLFEYIGQAEPAVLLEVKRVLNLVLEGII